MSIVDPGPSTASAVGSLPSDAGIGRSALRKASLRLIPIIALGYGISYMDRINISFAALQMNRDLQFSASIYGFGARLFFLSYALCEIPSNLLLCRFGARRWIARIMFTWGILAVGMMFVKNPRQFYAMRFLLGMAEGGFFPGVVFYLMRWFPREMRARTISRFYVAVPISSIVMGSIAGALMSLHGRFGLAGWQWLFLVEGLPAVLLSFVFLFYLPETPSDAKWLSADERSWIVNRLLADDASAVSTHDRDGVSAALKDPRVWLLGLFNFCNILCNYAYNLSAPTILQNLTGLSTTYVGFIVAGISVVGAFTMLLNSWNSDRVGERFLHIAIPSLLMAVGYIVGGFSTLAFVAIPAFMLSSASSSSLQGTLWAVPSSLLKSKTAATGLALIGAMGIFGGFFGPIWMGRTRDLTGSYRLGLVGLAVPSIIAAAIMLILRHRTQKSSQPI